jgi:hypothetical protein
MQRLYRPHEAAEILRIAPKTLYDRRWRARWGLRAVRVGGGLRFSAAELARIIARGQEAPGCGDQQ